MNYIDRLKALWKSQKHSKVRSAVVKDIVCDGIRFNRMVDKWTIGDTFWNHAVNSAVDLNLLLDEYSESTQERMKQALRSM
jgi:hypothetical protein